MKKLSALLLLTAVAPLTAQTSFRTTRHTPWPLPPTSVNFVNGDVDGDGDLDLVIARDFAPLVLLLNDGFGGFSDGSAGRLTTTGFIDMHSVVLADIDGDGDLDLLAANEDLLPNRVYTNDGTGVFTDVSAVALPPNQFDTKNQVVADFDGDGDVDILAVDAGGCHFYVNNGSGVFSDATATRLLGLSTQLGFE